MLSFAFGLTLLLVLGYFAFLSFGEVAFWLTSRLNLRRLSVVRMQPIASTQEVVTR
jgi:hypothetical protein